MSYKISIIMSTFNRDQDINVSIKSILNQTYTNFEFIICDDGSTDMTLHYLETWAKRDKRIKLLINEHNMGLQKSLNRCIDNSHGKYIARMDDDDVSLPNRLWIQLNYLRRHKNISFVGTDVLLFDSKYGIYGKSNFIKYPNKYQLFKRDEFCHPSILIRASVLKHVGGYSESERFFRIEDHELWLRLYLLGYQGANIKRILLRYTFDIHSNKNKFYDYYNRFRLLKYYKRKFHIGIMGDIYVLCPLLKILIPSFIRNMVYKYKYSKKGI